ncbi:hypothetical protein QQZ08_008001 [Neonectria magnoliae]|uniref:Nephrocystin 3-like N-terminal domain-containing protein n=1 Tax=Neonectria magnoliae TaxID=2732573 RepID=A0ABR1HWC2_9HYPO
MAVSYAYCEYDASKEDQEAISILKSIARQLVECAPRSQRSRLIQETRDFLKHLGPEKSATLEVDFLTSITSKFQQAIVVIDALDECPSEVTGGVTNRIGEIKDILTSAAEASKMSTTGEAHGSSGTHLSMSDPNFWYRLLIDRIKDRRDEGIQVLAWVSCANRRLSVIELQHAIAFGRRRKYSTMDPPEYVFPDNRSLEDLDEFVFPEDELLERCAGIVEIKQGEVSFAHQTIHEYLKDGNARRNIFDFCPQYLLAETCLRYFRAPEFESGFCKTEGKFQKRLESCRLYEYAAGNWGHHARASSGIDQPVKKVLLENGADPSSAKAKWSIHNRLRTPLSIAAENGDEDEVKKMLAKEANMDCFDKKWKHGALLGCGQWARESGGTTTQRGS